MGDLYSLKPSQIMFYGTFWCGDCRRARQVFVENGVQFVDVDIDEDDKAAEFVKQVNRGNRSVPTIFFPDGSKMTEPATTALAARLEGYKQTA